MAVKAEEAVEVKPGRLCRLRAACVVVEQHPDRTVGVAWQRQPRQRGMLWVEAQDVVEFLHERLLSVLRLARVAEQPQEEFECQLHLGKVTEDRKKGRIGDRVDMRGGHGTTWPSVAQLRPRVKCTWSSMCVHPLRE